MTGLLTLLVLASASPRDLASESGDEGVAPARGVGHCRAPESTFYSCRFGRKVGSVCLSEGAVHYRFGPPGNPEIDLASDADWSNIHVGTVIGQGGGHQTHVRFTTGHHHYLVFEGENGSLADEPGKRYSGIDVSTGEPGPELGYLDCRDPAVVPDSFSSSLLEHAPAAVRDGETIWEQQDGPFDGWF